MPQYYRYWRYEPGPVSGTFACKEINFLEYPVPTLAATGGEARILEVAALASESCRKLGQGMAGRKHLFENTRDAAKAQ